MPRKLRTPKPRRDQSVSVSNALYLYLVWHDFHAACAQADADGSDAWELFNHGPHHAAAWQAIADQAVRDWVVPYPGTRPRAWWWWSAPSLRQVFGRFTVKPGAGRCQATGIPFGAPDDWDDLPMVESQAGLLDRVNLWVPGERARVSPAAFAPEPFDWSLTIEKGGVPGDSEDEA